METAKPRGRPAIGEKVQVRLGALLPRVDAFAARRGINRAEALRRLLAEALDAQPAAEGDA